MQKKEYIHTGKCIWCKKSKPEVTFYTAPHIVPHALGAMEIGVDVCDACNHFFGTAHKGLPNIDLAFKEVFNASEASLGDIHKTQERFSSAYFFYDKKNRKIKLKKEFPVSSFTKQFKRGLFEAFLQKYHQVFPDENLDKFEAVRKFARYGEGNLNVYFIHNKIILHSMDKVEDVTLHISQNSKEEINDTGYFVFIYSGQILILEVLPLTASLGGIDSLRKVARPLIITVDGNEKIYRLDDIRHFDMFFNRLAPKQINTDNFLRR